MLDIKFIKENKNYVKEVCKRREMEVDVDGTIEKHKAIIPLKKEIDEMRFEKNKLTQEINLKRGKDCEREVNEVREIQKNLNEKEEEYKQIKDEYDRLMLLIPNILHEEVPYENKVIKEWGQKVEFDFVPKPNWEFPGMDFKNGIKLAGERGYFLKGKTAKMVRAIRNFILDVHEEYEEIVPPLFVNHEVLEKTGFFPGGEKEVYETPDGKVFIGTGEIPLIGMYAGNNFQETVRMKAYTPCFRREAGKNGVETRGLVRTHQFEKIELVTITNKEKAMEMFEQKVKDIERIYQLLELPYRIVDLAANDCAKKEYFAKDIEVWFAAEKRWVELGTIANCNTYAAKRARLKFKGEDAVTIYGTGGVPNRLLIAIINNYQTKDGKVKVPEALRKYVDFDFF